MTDPERILDRFRAGDRDAFTALYRVHHPGIYRYALHMTADPAAAAEITQDVFVWLIHHPHAYEPARGDLAAFLAGVARKLLLRRQAVERRWMPLDEAAIIPHQDPPPETDTAALRRAIASLPARYREAVVLCDLEGKTYEEAAGLLGCATGTVRSRLHRARDLLARKLTWKKQDQGCRI